MPRLPHKQCQILRYFGTGLITILICVVWACNSRTSLQKGLIGSWYNLDLSVSINHESEVDSAYLFEVPEGAWEATLNIKPIVTEFRADGSYRSEYRSLQDSLIRETEGMWEVSGDSLILVEDGTATMYHAKIDHQQVTFSGWLDWDQDGIVDDLYTGRQRRLEDGI